MDTTARCNGGLSSYWRMGIAIVVALLTFFENVQPASAIQITCAEEDRKPHAPSMEKWQNDTDEMSRILRLDERTKELYRQYARRVQDFAFPICSAFTISGRIEPGDAKKLDAVLRENPLATKINLISPGGNVDEAIEMARVIRKNLIAINVPSFSTCSPAFVAFEKWVHQGRKSSMWCDPERFDRGDRIFAQACIKAGVPKENCLCTSACVLVLAGAPVRSIRSAARRDVRRLANGEEEGVSYSNVGVHRPTADWLGSVRGSDAINALQQVRRNITQSLMDSEVPLELVDLMYRTSSGKMHFLTDDEVNRLLSDMSPAWEEKAMQTCGSGTTSEMYAARRQLEQAGQKDSAPYRQLDAQVKCVVRLQAVESISLR